MNPTPYVLKPLHSQCLLSGLEGCNASGGPIVSSTRPDAQILAETRAQRRELEHRGVPGQDEGCLPLALSHTSNLNAAP